MFSKANYWLVVDTVIAFIAATSGTVINFIIWQAGQDLNQILWLNLYSIAFLIIGAFLSNLTAVLFGIKFNYLLCRLFRVGLILTTLYYLGDLANNLLLLGALFGLTNSFTFTSKVLIDRLVVPMEKLVSYASTRMAIWSVVSLSIPLAVGYLLGGVEVALGLMGLAGGLAFALVLLIPLRIESAKQIFQLPRLLKSFFTDFEMRRIGLIYFSIGVSDAFAIGVLDVLILSSLGSIDNWSYVAVGLAFVTIVTGRIIRKNKRYGDNGFTRATLALAALVYGFSAVVILVQFNAAVFILFTVGATVFDVITGTILDKFIQVIESDNYKFENARVSYQAYSDIFRAVGMIIPIALLLLLPAGFVTAELLIIVLSVITAFPMIFAFAYRTNPDNPFAYKAS